MSKVDIIERALRTNCKCGANSELRFSDVLEGFVFYCSRDMGVCEYKDPDKDINGSLTATMAAVIWIDAQKQPAPSSDNKEYDEGSVGD